MAGIYIHIPFCKTRCIYCGFFSTTSLPKREAYVDMVCRELGLRKEYLKGEPIETIYFGGGTPSLLSAEQIAKILDTIYIIYNVRANAEITMEGNPDDLTDEFLKSVCECGVNRISMGIQTFNDKYLQFIRRRHTAEQARIAVSSAIRSGVENVSVDLMFGFPGQTLDDWKADVEEALKLPVTHISAYSLMYDEGTVLADLLDRGEVEEISDELSLEMYQYLVSRLKEEGFEHYEISNFCHPGFASRHNSSYWRSVPYLGVGAGAHSFDGESRQYNPESLDKYFAGESPTKECLTESERYNEFVFTGLRTCQGISLSELKERFGESYYVYCINSAKKHLNSDFLVKDDDKGVLKLSSLGVYISNDIMSDLMYVD